MPLRWSALVLLLLLAASSAASAASRTTAATAIAVSGQGHGHGVGLSQWGAEERASAGQDVEQILRFYYPGTTLVQSSPRNVRVLVSSAPRAVVGSGASFTVRDASGASVRLAGGHYAVGIDGQLGSQHIDFPATVVPAGSPVTVGAVPYAGQLRLVESGGNVEVVNEVPLEEYLVGVVSSEVPAYWHPEALRAQAIASRSYALANLAPSAVFDLYDDDHSQNYHGLRRNFPTARAAVAATRGQVMRYDGEIVNALFSASNGGQTSVPEGLWGDGTEPYFVSRPDPFDGRHAAGWAVQIPVARLRSTFPGLPAAIAGITIERNAGGRATSIDFEGVDGAVVSIAGYTFQQRLGLNSTYYTVSPVG